jgi:LPXTG-site transpeptidase (sortase) family protein
MSHNMGVAKKEQGVVYKISERPISFAAAFLGFFTLAFVFLSAVGATPDPLPANPQVSSGQNTQTVPAEVPEAPVRLVVKDAGIDTPIVTPLSTDLEVLNKSLEAGAMHWPTSAPVGVNGTVALFGHSSHLPVVYHQYYKLFNDIEKLRPGKVISVYSETKEYRYEVVSVESLDSTVDDLPLPSDAKYLVLVTCNNFGAKEKRFVVTANFMGAYALAN